MLRIPERTLRKVVPHMDLFIAGRYASSRDVHIAQARATKVRSPDEEFLVHLMRTKLIYRARQDHRRYWQAMQRVRLGQVVPLRIPVLQAAR